MSRQGAAVRRARRDSRWAPLKANARQEHHAGPLGGGATRGHRLEHRHLAGDIEVVRATAQACGGDGVRRARKRTGTVEDEREIANRLIECGRVVDGGDSMRESQLGSEPCQRLGAPSGEEWAEAARDGAPRD